MIQEINGTGSRQTGDINLASALMACAIPLDQKDPVRVIEAECISGSYASFRIAEASADGKHTTQSCMDHWSSVKLLPDFHPFATICAFIKDRPEGRLSAEDWLGYALSYLWERGIDLPGLTRISDIEQFVNKLPSAPESYILAFVANRQTCLALYRSGKRAIFQMKMGGDLRDRSNDRHTLIDAKLPAWQRNELLSRLQG